MIQLEPSLKFIVWCIITAFVIAIIVGYLSYVNIGIPTLERNHLSYDYTGPLVTLSETSLSTTVRDGETTTASTGFMTTDDLATFVLDGKSKSVSVSEINKQVTTDTSYPTDSVVKSTVHSLSKYTEIRGQNSRGYIMPYTIAEEQTMASASLWQLQILAKNLKMHVVEPFANSSIFRITRSLVSSSNSLRFGDYFDKEEWNKMAVDKGGSPLIAWEDFLPNAPREAVILITRRKHNLPQPLIITYNDVDAKSCNLDKIPKDDSQWLGSMFNITRIVCYLGCVNKHHDLSVEAFASYVFGESNLSQVTLITVGWQGIQKTRVDIRSTHDFAAAINARFVLSPSPKIIQAYKTYKSLYIGVHKYVGIVFRTHHVLYFSPPSIEKNEYLLQCSKNLSHVLDKVREKWKIFLSFDMGTYGSGKLIESKVPLRDQIFLDVFNGSLQVEEREEMLKQAAGGITDRGFIAQLEKMISTNADCIILLGKHSSFVRSSATLYMSLHPTNKCMIAICGEHVSENNKTISSTTVPDQFL